MTPDAATVAAVAREVLAEHRQLGPADVRWDREAIAWVHWWRCSCGHEVRCDQSGPYWFEDHVAAALLSSEPIAQALAAVARVEALADAKDARIVRINATPDPLTGRRSTMRAFVLTDELRATLRPEGGNQ